MKEISVLVVSASSTRREAVVVEAKSAACVFRIVAEAASGADGLELFFRHSPEVVFLDIRLPDVNGFSVLNQMRATNPECAVIMIANSPDNMVRQVCSLFGAAAIFYKSDHRIPVSRILTRVLPEKVAVNIAVDSAEPEITSDNFVLLDWP